jgi:hypothetical protein
MEPFEFFAILGRMKTRKQVKKLMDYLEKINAPPEYILSALEMYHFIEPEDDDPKWQADMK